MAQTIDELEGTSDEELRRVYNEIAKDTVLGLGWYREEIHRRRSDAQTQTLIRISWFIAALTAANVVLVIASIVS